MPKNSGGGRPGLDGAVEVDVAAFVDAVGRDGLAQSQLHSRSIWNEFRIILMFRPDARNRNEDISERVCLALWFPTQSFWRKNGLIILPNLN
jgi:hypothetical protein